jgi:hypothetical protein
MKAMYGRLITVTTTDGQQWAGVRMVQGPISALLDGITSAPGSMIYRSETEWVAIAPGLDGQFLTYVLKDGEPEWKTYVPPSPDIQALLESIGHVAGDVILFDGSDWVALPKGADSDVLTIDPTTHLPVWAPGGSSGGGAPAFAFQNIIASGAHTLADNATANILAYLNFGGGSSTITMPATPYDGQTVILENSAGGLVNITVTANSGQTIAGAPSGHLMFNEGEYYLWIWIAALGRWLAPNQHD